MKCIVVVCLIFVLIDGGYTMRRCRPARTTVSGTKAPRGSLCRGQLLLNEQFNTFDRNLWHHEVTLGGGGVRFLLFYFALRSEHKPTADWHGSFYSTTRFTPTIVNYYMK